MGTKVRLHRRKKDDKDKGEDIMIHTLTKAERLVLEEMYPVGSRVQLEYMDDPYGKLKPGDLGTVCFIDDTGSVHVSWDCGSSLAVLYKEDRCKCLMKSGQLDILFKNLSVMPFESLAKLKTWLEEKLRPVFPAMSFDNNRKGELEVVLHVDAFQMEKAKIGIKYQTDDKGNLYIEKCGWTQEPPGRKEVSKKVEHKR